MAIVTIDFESLYTQTYSLRKMSEVEYILSPDFQVILCGIKVGDRPTFVVTGEAEARRALADIDWGNTALLAHNTRFDGAILAWRFGIRPRLYLDTLSMARALTHAYTGSSSLMAVAKHLSLAAKGNAVVRAMGMRLEDFSPAQLKEYREYCAHDTELCRTIFDRFMAEYKFPRSELKVIDLALRMFILPQVMLHQQKLACYLDRVRTEKSQAFAQLEYMDRDVFSSNERFAQLLRGQGIDVPMKLSAQTGELTYALAKNDRAFKELCADPDLPPLVQAMLQVRLGEKSTIEETRSATLLKLARQDWRHALTAGLHLGPGSMPVPYRYYGAHCVPGSTEVLTRLGWVALENWAGGDIAQVHPDQTIEFLPASRYAGPVIEQWVEVRAPYLRCDFTLGHTVPRLLQHHFSWDTIKAVELLERSFIWAPLAGRLTATGTITPDQMRVLAMVQADGHWGLDSAQGRGLFVFVKKPRKIERARYLLNTAGVVFRESSFPSHPGYVRFSVAWRDLPEWLAPERKVFGAWLLDSAPEAREALMQEVQHWDGWVRGGQVCYSTSEKQNADWLTTLAHLAGRCASTHLHERQGRVTSYRVQLRQRNYGQVSQEHSELLSSKPQQAYCATTKTGFFLARSHGRIFVTGNTGRFSGDGGFNFANLKRGSPIRDAIVAPPGWRIVHRDSSQIEARMVAWLAGCEALVRAFAEGRDVYSEFASRFYNRPITKADVKERFTGKTCLAAGTRVLTNEGWFPIEMVQSHHKVWDGIEWVKHDGVIANGRKETLKLSGVSLTPDHLVWCGTQWRPAQQLRDETDGRFLRLAFAAACLPSPATYSAAGEALVPSWFAATAERPSTLSTDATSRSFAARDVMNAQNWRLAKSAGGNTTMRCLIESIDIGCLAGWLRQSLAATFPQLDAMNIMGYEASTYTANGAPIRLVSFDTSKPCQDGTIRPWTWTASRRTGTTNRAISGSQLDHRTHSTNGRLSISNSVSGTWKPVYDLLNAGPRHRFTVMTDDGPLIVSNCVLSLGYGCGHEKFRHALFIGAGGVSVDLELAEAMRLVCFYRDQYPEIPALWKRAHAVLQSLLPAANPIPPAHLPVVTVQGDSVGLPNGLAIRYPNLREQPSTRATGGTDIVYDGPYGSKRIYGPKLVENICQALARIVITDVMLRVSCATGLYPFMSTYDSLDYVCRESEVRDFDRLLEAEFAVAPSWATGLPLASEGGWGKTLLEAERGVNQ